MTTGLVALLLISQMSLASGNTSSRFTFDHNYSSLEIDNPEADNNDVSIFTPDFLHVSSEKSQKVIPHWPDYDSSVVHVRNVTFSYSIRAPPLVS